MQFRNRVLSGVARTGDDANPSLKPFTAGLEHLLGEINRAITCGLRANKGAAPIERFAGENTGKFVSETLVLAEEVTNFATADADVASGHVGVWTDVTEELGHERLAEVHDFVVGFVLGIEVSTALATTHR